MAKKKKNQLPAVVAPRLPEVIRAPAPTRDPLTRYLEELRRYPVLDPEKQHELSLRFRETGDREIARMLVTTNLRLVVKIAMEYRTAYTNVMDLIQEGNVGLMKAVQNYDPYKGTRLSYYASWWIRSYILKFLLDNFRLVKVGTTQAQKKLFYNLMREKERLEAQGIQAGPKLLAHQLNVKEKEVEEMSLRLSSRGGEVSLDAPVGHDEEGPARGDLLPDSAEPADEALAQQQLEEILHDNLGGFSELLNEKERMLFQDRLMAEDPRTLQEIADQFGITRERARQIETRVVEKLRNHMRDAIDGLPGLKRKASSAPRKSRK
ncbi:MAG: RNA polymerase factor sigma-32 [Bdellovibrionales bacterium]|nr:RNA polymerase factor sigma-32 [Bdellovibrionales bacterium]